MRVDGYLGISLRLQATRVPVYLGVRDGLRCGKIFCGEQAGRPSVETAGTAVLPFPGPSLFCFSLLDHGGVFLRIRVEILNARFAAEFHGGAFVLDDDGFSHGAKFLAGDRAGFHGIGIIGADGGCFNCWRFHGGFCFLPAGSREEGDGCDG